MMRTSISLARKPTLDEQQRLLAELPANEDAEPRELVEDLYWSLMSSREFLFNH